MSLPDVETVVLGQAVEAGIRRLEWWRDRLVEDYPEVWESDLAARRARARAALSRDSAEWAVRGLDYDVLKNLGDDLAALAMAPGGVRVCEIVFCAKHYRNGVDARLRLSCPKCSPDDIQPIENRDRRDVVSIEGTI
jgi:hypothetical protein